MLAEFLCEGKQSVFLQSLRPALYAQAGDSLADRISFLEASEPDFLLADIYPFANHLSDGIQHRDFLSSFFQQPDLFIRVHPGKLPLVIAKLRESGVLYKEIADHCLAMPNGTKLDQLFPDSVMKRPFEVQDLASQRSGDFFKPSKYDYWWDACAASGGKSLHLFHQQKDIKLLVSDVREGILENLDERFANAGFKTYQKKVLDLTKDPSLFMHSYQFDGIILDAPCTGSGTWGRSPELISQFEERQILTFQRLQRIIAGNVIKFLKEGKPLVYITCSVFAEENEANVDHFVKTYNLKVEDMELIKGYDRRADSMFVARLIR
jgi:16S rRNA (cytosine967-C5)-methyltransferase